LYIVWSKNVKCLVASAGLPIRFAAATSSFIIWICMAGHPLCPSIRKQYDFKYHKTIETKNKNIRKYFINIWKKI